MISLLTKQLRRGHPTQSNSIHGWIQSMSNSASSLGLPLTSSFLLEYSSEYLNEYSNTRGSLIRRSPPPPIYIDGAARRGAAGLVGRRGPV